MATIKGASKQVQKTKAAKPAAPATRPPADNWETISRITRGRAGERIKYELKEGIWGEGVIVGRDDHGATIWPRFMTSIETIRRNWDQIHLVCTTDEEAARCIPFAAQGEHNALRLETFVGGGCMYRHEDLITEGIIAAINPWAEEVSIDGVDDPIPLADVYAALAPDPDYRRRALNAARIGKVEVPEDHDELLAEAYRLGMRLDVLLNRLPIPPYHPDEELCVTGRALADGAGALMRDLSEFRHAFDMDAARGKAWLEHDVERPAAEVQLDASQKATASATKAKASANPRHPQRTRDTLLPGSLVTFADGDKSGVVIAVGSNRSNKQGDSLLVLESLTGDVWPEFIDDCKVIKRAGTAPVPIDSLATGGGGQGRVVGFVGDNLGKVGTIVVSEDNEAGLVYDPNDDEMLSMQGWAELT